MKDIIQTYFNQEAIAHISQAIGLDATLIQRALSLGLPLQVDALSAYASTPEGRTELGNAISNLPRFGSVSEALSQQGGLTNLQQAGESLAPKLLGGQLEDIAQQVTRRVGGSVSGVQKVLTITLPLLLSLFGRQGLTGANADNMLGGLRGTLGDLSLGGAVPATAQTTAPAAAALAANAITPSSLLEMLKIQFSGDAGEKIGRAAGLTGSSGAAAVLGTLPVVLNAIANKGRTEKGAAELLAQSQDFDRLVDDNGLKASLLGDSAEMARLEGQGRGLLGGLFENVDNLTGRLGTTLGSSGANAGRLLALITPLVLGLLGRAARTARMSPLVMTGLLGAMGDKVGTLVPAGLPGITALLGAAPAVALGKTDAPVKTETVVAEAAPETPVVVEKPAAAVTPPPPPAPTPVTETVTTTTERKGGIPWWVWLLPLLLIGGCLMAQRKPTTTPTTTTPTTTATTTEKDGIIVSNPESNSDLPAEPFTMSGTAAPDMHLVIEDQGDKVAEATADSEGNWTADLPAPTVGKHTYSIIGGENDKTEFKVNIVDAEGTDGASTDSTTTAATTETDGTFAIAEPAENAEVSGGGFNLKGTGEAGKTYELLEDGVSVGTFKVGDDGSWLADVAAPTAGDKTYTIRDADGNEVATLPVKVAAAEANAGECSDDLTVSLNDGETVTAPFRFGGVGNGTGYKVAVRRDGHLVGTKEIPLGAGCTWSYTSDPGGKSGSLSKVTYEVRGPDTSAEAPAEKTINLTVRAK